MCCFGLSFLINYKIKEFKDKSYDYVILKNEIYNLNGYSIPYYKPVKSDLIKRKKLPPMAEGLFYLNNHLYILFENSSDKYNFALPKMNKVIKINY